MEAQLDDPVPCHLGRLCVSLLLKPLPLHNVYRIKRMYNSEKEMRRASSSASALPARFSDTVYTDRAFTVNKRMGSFSKPTSHGYGLPGSSFAKAPKWTTVRRWRRKNVGQLLGVLLLFGIVGYLLRRNKAVTLHKQEG